MIDIWYFKILQRTNQGSGIEVYIKKVIQVNFHNTRSYNIYIQNDNTLNPPLYCIILRPYEEDLTIYMHNTILFVVFSCD